MNRHRFDGDPDPNVHFDADPNPDPEFHQKDQIHMRIPPHVLQVLEHKNFSTFGHSIFLISVKGVNIFSILDKRMKVSGNNFFKKVKFINFIMPGVYTYKFGSAGFRPACPAA